MKKTLMVLCATLLFNGCGSDDPRTSVPKSRMLQTGETSFVPTREDEEQSAHDQWNSSADRMITLRIRHAILEDKVLATTSETVRITTRNGNVTLHGTVHTEKDKAGIGTLAQDIAGTGNVSNQLEVVGY